MVVHCGCNFHFHMTNDVGHFFSCAYCHSCIFFGKAKTSVQIFSHLYWFVFRVITEFWESYFLLIFWQCKSGFIPVSCLSTFPMQHSWSTSNHVRSIWFMVHCCHFGIASILISCFLAHTGSIYPVYLESVLSKRIICNDW